MHDPATCTDRACKDLKCKLREWRKPGALVSPAATPTRRNLKPPHTYDNAWERGIARDERGLPIHHPGGEPMAIKHYVENRHSIDKQLEQMRAPKE